MVDRRPTIADVARQAGVSKGLVSFVVNNRPGVATETRDRIRAVAAELGWTPRTSARSLATRRAFALGLVVRREPDVLATDPFFPAFMAGVETELQERGQVLVLSMVASQATEERAYRTLAADARVDGVLLTDLRGTDSRIALVTELGLPAVAVGPPEAGQGLPTVHLDDAPGVAASVQHLVDLGHRDIAYVAGNLDLVHGRRRRDVYLAAMERARLPGGPVIVTDFLAADGATATATLLEHDPPPTAIVYANDVMAIAGMAVLHERGLRVPADLSVIGFDGAELSRHTYPALTTVVAEPRAWGSAAAHLLLQHIADGDRSNVELPPAALVVRDSTDHPAP